MYVKFICVVHIMRYTIKKKFSTTNNSDICIRDKSLLVTF